jgi:Uma2 family endonuclease
MSVETRIPLEEYLSTSYDPDVEYVDGVLVERNIGEWPHSLVHGNLIFAFRANYPKAYGLPAVRCKTSATRYRLPDIALIFALPKTKFLLDAPFLVVEVVSEDDSMSMMIEKLEEYARKGVANIWIVDPTLRKMFVYASGSLKEVSGDRIATAGEPRLELTRGEIFKDLDETDAQNE